MQDDLHALLERLRDVLEPRVGRNQTRALLRNLGRMREVGASEDAVLEAAHRTYDAFARSPASISPFGPALSKAIGDAAPRKLSAVGARIRLGRSLRGMDDDEARALAQHAELLARSYGEGDEAFAIGVAWRSALLYRHAFVLGEARDRNDPWPLEVLAEAWRRGEAAGRVPVLVVPEHGVVYATGSAPDARVLERWRPDGFLFVPDDVGGRWLRLEREDELAAFLDRTRPALTGATVPVLLHLLLAPFPWNARVRMDLDLLTALEHEEARLEAERASGTTVSLLLGVPPPAPAPLLEKLFFVVEPSGTEVCYSAESGLVLR